MKLNSQTPFAWLTAYTALLWIHTSVTLAYLPLQQSEHKYLISNSKAHELLDPFNKSGILEPILRERIPDTEGSKKVQEHIISFFEQQNKELAETFGGTDTAYSNWTMEVDRFQDDTPTKKNVTFTNLVFTRNPPGSQAGLTGYLSLVAHYDSKIEPHGFIGAIDSAVPCAMMMYAAKVLDKSLSDYWKSAYVTPKSDKTMKLNAFQQVSELGLQLIFLDGEEAYLEWSDTDSTYGARHLASKWDKRGVFHASNNGHSDNDANVQGTALPRKSKIEEIDAFVLMDLLGAKDTVINSYYENTDWMHKHLNKLEKIYRSGTDTKTKKAKQMRSNKRRSSDYKPFFPRSESTSFHMANFLSDDHLPFLHRGVPILHLIPLPFPSVWHTLKDDAKHLDRDSVEQIAHIMTAFVAEYMGISGHLGVDIRNSDL